MSVWALNSFGPLQIHAKIADPTTKGMPGAGPSKALIEATLHQITANTLVISSAVKRKP